MTTGWVTAQPGTGAYDVAYDIWFNRAPGRAPGTSGQPDGAELMIWLNHNGPVHRDLRHALRDQQRREHNSRDDFPWEPLTPVVRNHLQAR